MNARFVSPHLMTATIDFACESCPVIPFEGAAFFGFREPGALFTVNYCLEGCCEVAIPGRGYTIVGPGDVCVSCTDMAPQEYRYPAGRYRGVEVFAHTACANDPVFGILKMCDANLEAHVRKAGFATLYQGNEPLGGIMERLGRAHEAGAAARLAYEGLGLLLGLLELNFASVKPPVLLTRSQMQMVRAMRESVEGNLAAQHDVRDFAAELGLSASTLNNYFSAVFGQTLAAYTRRRRLEKAADLLAEGCDVATASACVGYANPSKLAAAFRRYFGVTPTEFKRRAHLEEGGRGTGDGRVG